MFFRKTTLNPCQIKMSYVDVTLEQSLFHTYHQSIVELSPPGVTSNNIHGLELLNRPVKNDNFLTPEQFYSFVAAHGKSSMVDVFTAEIGLQRWSMNSQRPVSENAFELIFVNIHLSTLFSDQWEPLMSRLPIDPTHIVLELSEREGLDTYSKEDVAKMISRLQKSGFKIAIDDLGMGYSGLYTLSVVHPDYVKIDRQLVNKIDADPYRQHMMYALLEYWNNEQVKVIAEGIERKEEAVFFEQNGATFAQGYFFHRPEQVLVSEKSLQR